MNKTIYILFLILSSVIVKAQETIIHGKLIDQQTGESLSGATIFYQQHYTFSDGNGGFELKHSENSPVKLIITHLGYEPYEESISFTKNEAISKIDKVPLNFVAFLHAYKKLATPLFIS